MNQPFQITAQGLTLHDASGALLADLKFQFEIGSDSVSVKRLEKTATGWRGLTNHPGVWLTITEGTEHLCLEFVAPPSKGQNLTYFAGSKVGCSHLQAFIPDANLGSFPTGQNRTFTVSSAASIRNKLGLSEDLWMIAPQPHVFGFGDAEGRGFSLSIPECMPVDATQLILQSREIRLSFNFYDSSTDSGRYPRVYVNLGIHSRANALKRHLELAQSLGLVKKDKIQPRWWHNPLYCTWGDQCWLASHRDVTHYRSLTRDRILGWADRIRTFYQGEVNFIIDDGYFMGIGDYRLNEALYASVGEFRALIAELKKRHFKVILWYSPFWLMTNSGAPELTEHPEWLLHGHDGKWIEGLGDWKGRVHYDWSNPEVRERHKQILHFLLVDLDADGMKVDMTYANPLSQDAVRHDPTWASGSQVCWKTLQYIHQEAIRMKPDVFMTFNGVESYFQPYVSAVRLNDLFVPRDSSHWYRRAELVTRLMPGVAIDVDGWPADPVKWREYPFVASVYGAPVTYYVEGTEVGDVAMGEAETNRLTSVWHTYDNAPMAAGDQVEINVDNNLFERRDASGRLKAKSVARRVFITYGNTIRLTANADGAVSIPLENGRTVKRADRVNRDGSRAAVSIHLESNRALLHLEDSAKGILYYELA